MALIRLNDPPGMAEMKYSVIDTDRHGNVRIYVRRCGRKIRLRRPPGSEAFLQEYREALAKLELNEPVERTFAPAQPGSFRWLCERYYCSAEFKGLKARTQQVRRLILDNFSAKHGSKPYAKMEPRHLRAWRDTKAEKPEAANSLVKAIRQVYRWAKMAGHCDINPAAEVPYIKTGSAGWHTWTIGEVNKYLEHHGNESSAGRALTCMLYTGMSVCDVVKLGRQHCCDGVLSYKRDKTSVPVDIPILQDLERAIDATPSTQLTLIVTAFGKPFSEKGFGNRVRKWCDAAGLNHCSSHGLRKAGATIAADNGATAHQLMAIFGWKTLKQAEHYTRQANRKKLAHDGMHFISLDQKENESVPLSSVIAVSGTKRSKK